MKKFFTILVLMLTVTSLTATARTARKRAAALPLMPEKSDTTRVPGSAPAYVYSNQASPTAKKSIGLGVEFGTFGRSNRAAEGFLGMEYLVGGRFFLALPLRNSRWNLRPSLGYFRRSDEEALVSVTQNNFEFGLGVLYLLTPASRARVLVGLSNRVDMVQSSITAPNDASEGSPFGFTYRLGPELTIEGRVAENVMLHFNTEFTMSVSSPLRTHAGMSAGFSIGMW